MVRETNALKGYKQTEMGIIPDDWNVAKIGEHSYVTKLAGFEYTGYFDYSRSGPIIALRVLNIKDGALDLTDIHTIPKETSEMLPRSRLAKGDLAISYVGTIGRVAVIPEDNKYHLAPNVAKISVNRKEVDPFFLNQFLNSAKGQKEILKVAASTTQAALSMQNLRSVLFILPPLPQQQAIAEALGDVDALIAALDRFITKKCNIKQGAMQQLLTGKTRLPGFSGEWEVKTLGEIFNISAGGDFIKRLSSNVRDAQYCYPIYSNSISEKGLYGYCTYGQHKENCITVTARGTIGVANARDHKFTAIGRVLVLEPKFQIDILFVSEYINNNIEFAIESTGVPQLTAPQIAKYEIKLPAFTEQQAIAHILSDMDAEIEALERKRGKYTALKQGMMQALLTGRIRLI